jgi:HEAT repeat protein
MFFAFLPIKNPGLRKAGGTMDCAERVQETRRIEHLVTEMGLAFNRVSLYQAGHPSLAGSVERLHRDLVEIVDGEPSGRLLLGVARDRILYRDVFLSGGSNLVRSFISELFLQQVATLDFSGEVTPQGLLVFFLSLQRLRTKKEGERKLGEILEAEGVRGIGAYPYNYKEVLSRGILLPGEEEEAASPGREDEIWRMLLSEPLSGGGEGDGESPGNLRIPPEMIPAILMRVRASAGKEDRDDGGREPAAAMSAETIRRVLKRLGSALRRLPAEQRVAVILSLDKGAGDAGGAGGGKRVALDDDIARSLALAFPNDEFLDLLAGLVAVEGRGGSRFRKVFEIIAGERNAGGSLLPAVRERARESARAGNGRARMTWETVERLLLQQGGGNGAGRELHDLPGGPAGGVAASGAPEEEGPRADPADLAEFGEEFLRRKEAVVLLELLAEEKAEAEFLELLEEIRKILPDLLHRGEISLLKTMLSALKPLLRDAPAGRREAIGRAIGEVDFARMVDLFLSPAVPQQEKDRVEEILVSFAAASIDVFLDRLRTEADQKKRKALLSLASRFDGEAVPAIRKRLDDTAWYFVRNLCIILGRIGGPSAVHDLVRLLDHKDLNVRKEAIQALGQLRAPESVPFLGKVLLNETFLQSAREEALRIDAANAVFRCGGTRAASLLYRGAESGRARVRKHCAALLDSMRPAK